MLRRFYDWLLLQAGKKHATWVMAGISFAESSFFPLPPDLLLVPMMLEKRRLVWWYATVATLSSVLGGYVGYAIGYFLFEAVGQKVIDFYGLQKSFADFEAGFQHWGIWFIIVKGLTPIPYKIVTIACGVLHFNLALFTLGSIAARAVRFFSEAALFHFKGDAAKVFIETRLTLVTTVSAVVLVSGVVLFKYAHFGS
jgi:membrane protein YqaA with SNARE-associated domain